jgi:FKBP-type peptidyl-prolyl cis-trans isomerase
MKKVFLVCVAALAIASCQPQEKIEKVSDYAPKNEKERLSYAMGHQIGKELSQDKRQYDMDAMLEGIKAAWSKSTPAVAEEEMQNAIKEQMLKEREENAKKREESWEVRNKLGEFYQLHGQKYLENHAKEDGVKIAASGLQYKHIVEGKGKSPKQGDMIEVQIRGTFIDGKEFENTYTRMPVNVKVGVNSKGLDEAFTMMKEGGKAEFVIPAKLGYGAEGAGLTIPPHAVLVYEIELLKVK